ncbi:MAG TPA: type II CAAX endopeptidase family protein [Tepidisphaeraceae bacterium]|nr:type II CAAX endopeptidase family protein [Tepidisphaeraceae bacterium]
MSPCRCRIVCRVGMFLGGGALILAVFSPLTSPVPAPLRPFFLGITTSIATLALTLLFVQWDNLRLGDVGIAPSKWSPPRFALGFLIGLLLVALSASIQTTVGHARWARTPDVGFVSVTTTLFSVIALASREELAFRGYPLRRLEHQFGLWPAQITIALVFALEHWLGGWPISNAVFGAGIGSLVFGMAAIATKGLALPIGLHAAWNFGDSMIGQNYFPGLWHAIIQDQHAGQLQTLIITSYLIPMSLAFLLFWFWHRRMMAARN